MRRRSTRCFTAAALTAAGLTVASALTGCAGPGGPTPSAPGADTPGSTTVTGDALQPNQADESTVQEGPLITLGTVKPYPAGKSRPGTAVSYDSALVRAGATLRLSIAGLGGRTVANMTVTGLVPNHAYGAHLHTKPCGPKAADAGPHYQHIPDPHTPSVDPTYANPQNEVWLDFRTGSDGAGSANAVQQWMFTSDAPARSLVIHEKSTATAKGHAGMAGARVGCLTLET
jgi:Cu-Zn family superoxide dismutase